MAPQKYEKALQTIKQAGLDKLTETRILQQLETTPQLDDLYPKPFTPLAEWFQPKKIHPGEKMQVHQDSSVQGRFFHKDACIINGGKECWKPQPSPSGYEDFHQSVLTVQNADGTKQKIMVGMIVPGHSDPDSSVESSIEHYNDPTKGLVYAKAFDDEHGGYIVGCLVPHATYADALLIDGAPLSGHWTWRERFKDLKGRIVSGWDCIGPSMVVRPGLPLPAEHTQNFVESQTMVASVRPNGDVIMEMQDVLETPVVSNKFSLDGLTEYENRACSCSDRTAVAFDENDDDHRKVFDALVSHFAGDDSYAGEGEITDVDIPGLSVTVSVGGSSMTLDLIEEAGGYRISGGEPEEEETDAVDEFESRIEALSQEVAALRLLVVKSTDDHKAFTELI